LENNSILNIDELMLPLRVPYIHYRKMIQEYADESTNVLEIGAGMGENIHQALYHYPHNSNYPHSL
jgi:tRNA G46 methylase TrmB